MPLITIAVPSYDRWHAGFGYDLACLVAYATRNTDVGREGDPLAIGLQTCQSTYLPEARDMLYRAAKADGADGILWLDADMRFPADALHRLLRRSKSIVGAHYATRRPPHRSVAIRADGTPLPADGTGLVAVHSIGFGCLYTSMLVFAGFTVPPFATPWVRPSGEHDATPRIMGEDSTFCAHARATGWWIYVDQDLSREVRHVGEREYGLIDVAPSP